MSASSGPIADFTDTETWTLHSALRERYGRQTEPARGEPELRQNRHARPERTETDT